MTQRFTHDEGDDDSDEFIARISDEVENLRFVADRKQVTAEFEGDNLDDDNGKGRRGRQTEKFRMEGTMEAGEEGGEKNVCDKRHN